MDAMFKAFPGASGCQKTLKIMFNPVFSKTSGGILKGPSSSSPKDSKNLLHLYTTPATALCEVYNEQDLMYMHLLFGLKDRKLGMLEANFSSYIYHMFIFLEHNWEKLVEDIRLGRISPDATPKTDHDLRERIMREAKITPVNYLFLFGHYYHPTISNRIQSVLLSSKKSLKKASQRALVGRSGQK